MKLGLLTDIHEEVDLLGQALAHLRAESVDSLIQIGDICSVGEHLPETVALLREAGVIGVWGNHDYGLCGNVEPDVAERHPPEVLRYFQTLQPWLRIEDLLFQHVEPWLDPNKVEDLWYFEGYPQSVEPILRGFAAGDHRISFHGHYHRWFHGTAEGIQPWDGTSPLRLNDGQRHMIVINALVLGWCATFDTHTGELVPIHLPNRSDVDSTL